MSREVLQQALEALENAENSLGSFVSDHGWSQSDMDTMDNATVAIIAIKAALAQPDPVLAEREACAGICDVLSNHPEYSSQVTKLAAMSIRSRRQS